MTLAMKRLKNLGWLALVFLVAILLYPLSLNVAATHSDLARVDSQILETKREISFLQAELRTRASVQQLAEWNELLYGYEPPTAEQFVEGEAALANLGGSAPTTKPVMVAIEENVAPAGVVGSGNAAARSDSGVTLASLQDEAKPRIDNALAQPAQKNEATIRPPTRTEKLAKIDDKLLSDDFMREIDRRAAKEQTRK